MSFVSIFTQCELLASQKRPGALCTSQVSVFCAGLALTALEKARGWAAEGGGSSCVLSVLSVCVPGAAQVLRGALGCLLGRLLGRLLGPAPCLRRSGACFGDQWCGAEQAVCMELPAMPFLPQNFLYFLSFCFQSVSCIMQSSHIQKSLCWYFVF